MVNMNFENNLAPYEGGGGNLDNTIACTNAVQTAGYNFDLSSGGYIAGNPAVVSGGTNPMEIDAGSGPLSIINQTGGARRRRRGRKSKRSKKLRRSNKSRLSNKSKKSRSRSASRSKVKVSRKSLRKSKKRSKKSLK